VQGGELPDLPRGEKSQGCFFEEEKGKTPKGKKKSRCGRPKRHAGEKGGSQNFFSRPKKNRRKKKNAHWSPGKKKFPLVEGERKRDLCEEKGDAGKKEQPNGAGGERIIKRS